jgi:hypothetical protein
MDRIRHQLFLTKDLSERLEVLGSKPGASKSAILVDALTAWLNRRGASELEDKFGSRLDRMTNAVGRIERDGHILLETLALFVLIELTVNAPLPKGDDAARAVGRARFEEFVTRVGERLASGRRTLAPDTIATLRKDQAR